MKILLNIKIAVLALVTLATPVLAQTTNLTWDASGTTTNSRTDGSGTWSTSNTNWWNGTTNIAWVNSSNNIASIGANSGAAGIITVSGTVDAGGLIFNRPGSGNYTLTNGTINLLGEAPTIGWSNNTAATQVNVYSTLAGANGFTFTSATNQSVFFLYGSNTYTGVTTIGSGRIIAMNDSALGATGTGNNTVISNGATLQIGASAGHNLTIAEDITATGTGSGSGAITFSGTNNVLSGAVTMTGTTLRIASLAGSTNATITGGVTKTGAASTDILTLGAANNAGQNGILTVSNNPILMGDGQLTIINANNIQNAGAVVLAVAGNTFSRLNIDFYGTLRTDVANAWTGTPDLVMGPAASRGGTFDLNGNSQAVANMQTVSTATNIITSASAATLTTTQTTNTTFAGSIEGALSLVKNGTGTLTLTGSNTYTGATTVAGGTLRIDGSSRLGNTTNTLTISNAGVLDVTAAVTLTNAMTIGTGNGVLLNSSSGALVVEGNVSKDGVVFTSRSGAGTNVFTGVISGASANSDFIVDGGTTVFSNVMTYNGPTTITNGGTLVVGVDDAMPSGSDLILGGGTFLVGVLNYNADSSLSMGTITLTADSTIDLGGFGANGNRRLVFADSSGVVWTTNAVLTITNWQGVASQQSEVTKLLFGTGGLTSTQLAQIRFADQNIDGGQLLGAQGELAPIPEAGVVWGAGALAAFIVWRERRRLARLLRVTRERPRA